MCVCGGVGGGEEEGGGGSKERASAMCYEVLLRISVSDLSGT